MRNQILYFFLGVLLTADVAEASVPWEKTRGAAPDPHALVTRGGDCAQGSSRFDMDVNNVRATLLSSGDVWWDLTRGRYVVPKVDPATGAKEVSSIFAGAVWLGGFDPGHNLKLAAQTYRDGTHTDFWPGPLRDRDGTVDAATCAKWDRHFLVTGKEVEAHLRNFRQAKAAGVAYDCSSIPDGVKGWPAKGNPYFFQQNGFELPSTTQGLAKFHDEDGDGLYNPCKGDYPIIDIRGCDDLQYPDQMVFWIYNDAGGVHTQSERSTPIQMEVQVQAFAYATNDELNNMTFQRYKLINRATQDIDSCYFAMWVDFDLGCYADDYVGCDSTRSLAFCYNAKAVDGLPGQGTVCDRGVNTYGTHIPIIGCDYFRGPRKPIFKSDGVTPIRTYDNSADSTVELGLSSFTYYNNQTVGNPLPGTSDPTTATEYYNYLTGSWKDGTRFTRGGTNYNPGSTKLTHFAFPDNPSDASGESMCSLNLPFGDRRIIQASGPFRLKPGAINELIVGLPWVPDQKYPCPDIFKLREADDIAQSLFDNCFKITNGPDAPDLSFIELDREIVLTLSNDTISSNNSRERYKELGIKTPAALPDSLRQYRFQGYKIFQLADGNRVASDQLDNPASARLVAEVDVRDSVADIYNWTPVSDPNFPGRTVYAPVQRVKAANGGIRHTFDITTDLFAAGDDKRLINHKKYYYIAVAFAYNQYQIFDEKTGAGQREPYLEGRRNIGSPDGGNYTVTPRPIVDRTLHAKYADGPVVTRTDGVGDGGNFLDLSDSTINAIFANSSINELTYLPGRAPIGVKIYDPLDVKNGHFELTIQDPGAADVTNNARWILRNTDDGTVIRSETTIQNLNEQIISQYGFTISIAQVAPVGTQPLAIKSNGAIGSEAVYADPNGKQWAQPIPPDAINGLGSVLHYIQTGPAEPDFELDPNQSLSNLSQYFVPYYLAVYNNTPGTPLISPAWQSPTSSSVRTLNGLYNLNNVNIVFTKDKSKWSRCVVVETAAPYYNQDPNGLQVPTVGNAKMFDLRKSPSVSKDANADGTAKPDGTGTGYGWFPGYAIDVESGRRLNIFFGENSAFDPNIGTYAPGSKGVNRDMIFDPTSQTILPTQGQTDLGYSLFLGGQHFVYVTNQLYDGCDSIGQRLTGPGFAKVSALRRITWAGIFEAAQGTKLLSYADGLIPNDLTIKLRVDKAYQAQVGDGKNKGFPTYKFTIDGSQATALTAQGIDSSLNDIKLVPNPYYGGSAYEVSEFSNTIKITNLPAKCIVTIYSLDGKFIREFRRDESPTVNPGNNPGVREKQIVPDLEWDLKNSKGVPTASGVYLFHVVAPGLGERTLKWFGVAREFDPSRQ